jgi:hypothetical protein
VSFVNGAFLGALGLISLPIIIHLLNRRRFKIVRWAAMEYLLAANKKNRKRIRMEHFLVLLLRCLLIALLVLAVCRPETTSGSLLYLPGASDPIERVVLLDDSGSMGYQTGRTSSWDRARRKVKSLIQELRQSRDSDYLSLFRSSQLEPTLLARGVKEAEVDDALERLDATSPAARSLDVAAMLEHVIARVGESDETPRQKVIYVVSDLRSRDWIGPQGMRPKAIGDALRKAPEDYRFLFVDVGSSERQTLSVTRFEPAEKLAMVDVPLELVFTVANRGEEAVYDVPLALESGDSRVPLAPIARIDPGEEVEARHRYTFVEQGVHSLTVRLPDDALASDDARHLTVEVSESLKVLLVDGEEGAGPLGDETDLLRLALAPSGDTLTGVDPSVCTPQTLSEEELANYGSVVVCNVERWPAEREAELRRYVERGGGLALFMGDRVDTEAWNRGLYEGGEGVLPVRLGRRLESETFDDAPGILPPVAEHPLVEIFLGDRNPFLKHVRGRVRLACEARSEDQAEAILVFEDPERTPLLVEKTFGKGRVLLFNTSADLDWSTWPRDPSFPVTAQELVRLLAPAATSGRNLAVGEALERGINPAQLQAVATIAVPGEDTPRELHAEPRPESDALWLRFAETARAGVYRITLSDRQSGEQLQESFAVNLDPGEGDTEPADPARVQPALEGVEAKFVQPGDEDGLLTLSDGTKSELWRTCLLFMAICMALEQILAWRAAHHGSARSEEVAA